MQIMKSTGQWVTLSFRVKTVDHLENLYFDIYLQVLDECFVSGSADLSALTVLEEAAAQGVSPVHPHNSSEWLARLRECIQFLTVF